MKKILFYSHTGTVSGAENMLLMALKRIDRRRFAPLAVCPAEGSLAIQVAELGVPVKTIDPLEARFTWRPDLLFRYLGSFVGTYRQLRAAIKDSKPDLIHANSIRAGLAATAASVATKTAVFWHLQDELPRHPLSTAIRILAAASPRVHLIAASKATADSFRGLILRLFQRRMPLRVIHNVVELDKFNTDPRHRDEIRKEFGLGESEFVVGIVGQITPRKGQLELIRVFANSQSQMPSATLLIVGAPMFNKDHLYLEEIKNTTRELGMESRVKFTGKRQDVVKLMQALDVLVVNSKSEAFVIVALEAMACGTPVVATDVGGIREMIDHRVSGWLVPFGDESQLAEALATLGHRHDIRSAFSAAGKRSVAERFHAGKFIADLEEFFEQTGNASGDRAELVPAEQ
jgi:glycosyltransferase involved in cell wall biosynthesis